MTITTELMRSRRFLPLFCTQLLNAFNDNLYKTVMVLFVVYAVYNSTEDETLFSGLASFAFILPFFILSALAGQLADMRDKAAIIRKVKLCEIAIMSTGALGLVMAWRGIAVDLVAIPLLLFVLFLAGCQSTFLGPIKYAILPQHLRKEEVLAGTGLVEAGTYVAILAGTILAGPLAVDYTGWAALGIIGTAAIGYFVSRSIPAAPPMGAIEPLDWNIWRSSVRLIRSTMHDTQIYYAILAISFFWTIG
ncbi:MAG: MFS transporter, partial [Erythrobacter sp.]|nr:MFS transporter [Erythrobacter sp.]